MYAIVKTGGRQYKVAEGDIVKVEKIEGELGSSVALTPVLLVDGATVTTKADELAKVKVSAEIIDSVKGPKIKILKYKNKTGYKKRQGHRQPLTVLKITGIKKIPDTDSYHATWTEEEFNIASGKQDVKKYECVFAVTTIPPKDDQTLLVNPLGLYISDLNFSAEIGTKQKNNQSQPTQQQEQAK